MTPVKLGLIGLGEWPREAYVPILKELSEANVAAVAARTEATQQFARDQFGEGIALYGDYHDLLKDDNVEAVAVALPNDLHAEGIQAAAASGKHVFFEPPIGLTQEEVGSALPVLLNSNSVIQCDLELRYLPVIDFVRELIASGRIGEPLMAKVRLWADWGYGGGEWNQNPGEDGFFPWLGCWYLDLLDCVFEASPTRANVIGGYAMNGRLMDHGYATLEYSDAKIGEFEFSLIAVEGLSVSLNVLCTEGELEAELTDGRCRWRGKDGVWQQATRDCSRPMHGFVGMRESIAAFMSAVQNKTPVSADVEVVRRIHETMLACAQSETGRRSVKAKRLT